MSDANLSFNFDLPEKNSVVPRILTPDTCDRIEKDHVALMHFGFKRLREGMLEEENARSSDPCMARKTEVQEEADNLGKD